MGGGPSSQQKDAAAAQADASRMAQANSKEALQFQKDQLAKITPFETDRLNNGLPFFNSLTDATSGVNAQAFAPQKAQMLRQMGPDSGMPSGFRSQMLSDFEANKARSFDGSLTQNLFTNEQAKQDAARVLTGQAQLVNPLGWSGAAMQGNSSVMNAPLQSPGMAGILGGVAQGAASAIPF